jgi:DNA-binding transcriptional ArsR family regulator
MADLQRPPLDADVYEEIKVEQHEIDKRYLTELELLRVSPLTRLREDMSGLPPSPTRPLYLLRLLREYACARFDAEARRYPSGNELPQWLLNLGERIEARVSEFLRAGPGLRGSLDYHATLEEMKTAIHESLRSRIEDCRLGFRQILSSQILNDRITSSPAGVGGSSETQRHGTVGEQIRKLSDECRLTVEELAEAIEVSPRTVYRHLAGDAQPQPRHLAAYEKHFTARLRRPVQIDVKRQ